MSESEPELPARALGGSEEATLELEVVDACSGALLPTAIVGRTGPGLAPERRAIRGGRATLPVRTRLPFDLEFEADGYEKLRLRQTKLHRGEQTRSIRVALRAR
ncbi:MAG: hypothetical protein JNM84_06535 [Planctomycetes bacterium]|nr:hypothetical protein [Planctomycetota bacterium]